MKKSTAVPSPDWSVSVDGDLCMRGESLVAPSDFSPSQATYAEAVANIKLAAAAPAMRDALSAILEWCAGGDLPEELANAGHAALNEARTGVKIVSNNEPRTSSFSAGLQQAVAGMFTPSKLTLRDRKGRAVTELRMPAPELAAHALSVRFDTSPYVRSHCKEPRGAGAWAFEFEDSATPWFAPSATSLRQAKAFAAAEAKRRFAGRRSGSVVLVKVLP